MTRIILVFAAASHLGRHLPAPSALPLGRGFDTTLAARIEAFVTPRTAAGEFSGTILVGQNGRIVFERSYGLANAELGVAASNTVRYRIFSITKQFTAMAVTILAHRGVIDIRAPLRHYLPELPSGWGAATVEEVLEHTSGIPGDELKWVAAFDDSGVRTQIDALRWLAPKIQAEVLAEPAGTAWRYNNFGYDLLACLVERVSGRPFETFVAENIFAPSHMTDAGFDLRRITRGGEFIGSAFIPRLATGYNGTPDSLMMAHSTMYASTGAGGIYATAEDLFRYSNALDSGTLLPLEHQRPMVTRAFRIRPGVLYGYGWVVTQVNDTSVFVHHSGGNNGYTCEFARYPSNGVVIEVLGNRGFVDVGAIRDSISAMLFGDRYLAKRQPGHS